MDTILNDNNEMVLDFGGERINIEWTQSYIRMGQLAPNDTKEN